MAFLSTASINMAVSEARYISKRLILSYIFDWILIGAIAALGFVLNWIEVTSTRHAFSLTDPSISYPYKEDTVSVRILAAVGILGPSIITAVVSLLIPLPFDSSTPRSLIVRRKLWEWNTAWMGLGLALASTFMITEGLKDLGGKPRPHLLALCQPDTSPESIRRCRVGGLEPIELTTSIPILVTWEICHTANSAALHNAFASWPSGHSSFSWAGMLYLTLFLCAKLGVHIPLMLPSTSGRFPTAIDENSSSAEPRAGNSQQQGRSHYRDASSQAAAPPVYLLLITMIPVGAATYIAVSRWFDYRHHGIDILSGSLIGATCAYFSFRLYHLPIRDGAGWSWGARSRDRAFWLGIGTPSYAGCESPQDAVKFSKWNKDVEVGTGPTGFENQSTKMPSTASPHIQHHAGPQYGRSIVDKRLTFGIDERYLLSQRSSGEVAHEDTQQRRL